MPLIQDINTRDGSRFGVWCIEEDAAFFASHLMISDAEQKLVDTLNPSKKIEWLASRYVLDQIIDHHERIETATLSSGKPYLIGRKEHISLSHSEEYVAAIVGHTDVGIDIQRYKTKILAIEHKFAQTSESSRIDRANAIVHLHVLWSAKEVLYKIYARKQLSFTSHIFVDLPETLKEHGTFSGTVNAPDETIPCSLEYLIHDNFVLVYGWRNPSSF